MKRKNIIALLLSIIISSATFFFCGLLLLPAEFVAESEPAPVDETVSGIEYYDLENRGVLFCLSDNSGLLLYLDFENCVLKIEIYNDHAAEQAEKSRYKPSYKIMTDTEFLCRFCDRIGGIDLGEGSGKRRFFSASLRQKLTEKTDYATREEISIAFFEKIAKIGLSSEDFKFIIEETNTNLSYPACYKWIPRFKELAENCVFEGG